MDPSTLSNKENHWENTFESNSNMFGNTNSTSSQRAVEIFKKENKFNILELGDGQK